LQQKALQVGGPEEMVAWGVRARVHSVRVDNGRDSHWAGMGDIDDATHARGTIRINSPLRNP
jgi:hypothetical protein